MRCFNSLYFNELKLECISKKSIENDFLEIPLSVEFFWVKIPKLF